MASFHLAGSVVAATSVILHVGISSSLSKSSLKVMQCIIQTHYIIMQSSTYKALTALSGLYILIAEHLSGRLIIVQARRALVGT